LACARQLRDRLAEAAKFIRHEAETRVEFALACGRCHNAVAHKRPPKHTANMSLRQYELAPKGAVEIIDAMFAEQIDIIENGVWRRVSAFEAILLQL
jgi:hypothetical protein